MKRGKKSDWVTKPDDPLRRIEEMFNGCKIVRCTACAAGAKH